MSDPGLPTHALPPSSAGTGFFSMGALGAEPHLGPRSAGTQLSRVLEGSDGPDEAREECRQAAQSRPPAKDNCSRSLILREVNIYAARKAAAAAGARRGPQARPAGACSGPEDGLLTGSKCIPQSDSRAVGSG